MSYCRQFFFPEFAMISWHSVFEFEKGSEEIQLDRLLVGLLDQFLSRQDRAGASAGLRQTEQRLLAYWNHNLGLWLGDQWEVRLSPHLLSSGRSQRNLSRNDKSPSV